MTPTLVILLILAYFGMLIAVSFFTTSKEDNQSFFLAGRQSPWYVVAFGMIGSSLSGVTFISIPGAVATGAFSYMQVVFGYLIGYIIIATVLMPMYYRLNLTSIYTYLNDRFGKAAYKTGASYFLISRMIGSAFRLYLVAMVLHLAVFEKMTYPVPFWVVVLLTIALIWVYTFKGGIKTIIWTDTLQTVFMLAAVVLTIIGIGDSMGVGLSGLIDQVAASDYSQIFFFEDINDKRHFFKQFTSGIFIAIVMTGLDQDMMQKNLSCKNIREAQINMFSFSTVLVFVNLMFLVLGASLYLFAGSRGIEIPAKADQLYGMLAMDGHLGTIVAVCFILGLIAAAYSSADSAIAALTTSFCVDIIDIKSKPTESQIPIRKQVHIGISLVMALVIIIFKELNNDSVINELFTIAGYTYGPLLGLYAFGMMTKRSVMDRWIPLVCIASPILCYLLKANSQAWLNGYVFGFELLIINGLFTFIGLFLIHPSDRSAV